MLHVSQIKGGLLNGPLAFYRAISREAAKIKGSTSEVLAPDLEPGNVMTKQLSFLVQTQR